MDGQVPLHVVQAHGVHVARLLELPLLVGAAARTQLLEEAVMVSPEFRDVDLTQPYVWSTTRQAWANSGCAGCEYHIPDASPETTALIARLDRELTRVSLPGG